MRSYGEEKDGEGSYVSSDEILVTYTAYYRAAESLEYNHAEVDRAFAVNLTSIALVK